MEQDLAAATATLGPDHLLFVSGLNNLGLLYQDMQRYDAAAELHLRSLEILKRSGRNRIAYASTLATSPPRTRGWVATRR